MRPVFAIGLAVLVILVGITVVRLLPARYTFTVEGTQGSRYALSVVESDGRQTPKPTIFTGTIPDSKTFWSTKPLVVATFAAETEATLEVKRWGKVCATATSRGGLVKSEPAECIARGWF